MISLDDLYNIHVEDKSITVRLADVLKVYEKMMQAQGSDEEQLTTMLKQLQVRCCFIRMSRCCAHVALTGSFFFSFFTRR